METDTLLELLGDIVSAHVSNNSVPPAELPDLIQTVYAALASAGQPAPAEPEALTPAVSIRSSIKPDKIACLECGARFKTLKRHLGTVHALMPAEYRARWGLAASYPLVSPDYAETRRQTALRIGLGHNMKGRKRAKTAQPKKPAAPKRAPGAPRRAAAV